MTAPPRLRSEIARDLEPARPLRTPVQRVLALAPLALVTVVAVPFVYVFREDLPELGLVRSWGLSAAEAIGGLAIVAAALTESIPGRTLRKRTLAILFAAGLALPFVVLALTTHDFSIGTSAGGGWTEGAFCLRTSALAAVPILIAAAILVARAFALRPGVAGALYGLGCGVVADAGLRLFCNFSVPSHFISAHEGGVVAAMCVGAAIAKLGIRN